MRAVTRAPGRTLSSPPAGRRSGLAAHEGYWGRHACQALPARVTVLDVQLQRRCLGRAQQLAPQTITGHHPPRDEGCHAGAAGTGLVPAAWPALPAILPAAPPVTPP